MPFYYKYTQLMQDVERLNIYKYAAYRMGMKMKKVQKAFLFHLADLNIVSNTFQSKKFQEDILTILTLEDVKSLLQRLYDVIKRQTGCMDDLSSLTNVFIIFISKVFSRKDNFPIYQLKFICGLLSASKLGDKQKYIFSIFSNNGFISEEHLYLLLECFAMTAEALGEKLSFGCQYLRIAMKNCLKFTRMQGEITESLFMDWLALEPQTVIFLSAFQRLTVSEKSEHQVKCNICKSFPIRGMRYRCLYCFKHNSCQECFLRGYFTKSHEIKHRTLEFCVPASFWDEAKTYWMLIQNRILLHNRWREHFLVFKNEKDDEIKSVSTCSREFSYSKNIDDSEKVLDEKEMFNVIEKLDDANRCFQAGINKLEDKMKNASFLSILSETGKLKTLQESIDIHVSNVEIHLMHLKQLLQCLKHPMQSKNFETERKTVFSVQPCTSVAGSNAYFESTPLAAGTRNIELQSPQNLSKFIKYQAKLEGLTDLSKTVSTQFQVNSLYSLADIEMEYSVSCANKSYENMKEVTETVVHNVFTHNHENKCPSNEELCSKSTSDSSGISSKSSSVHNTDINDGEYSVFSAKNASNLPGESNTVFHDLCSHTSGFKDSSSIEDVETELQQVLQQLESLHPKVVGVQQNIPEQKDRFLSALSEMEEALKRLSTTITEDEFSSCHL